MNILITGANGFIGQHLVKEALKRDMKVFAGVRASSNRESIKRLVSGYVHFDLDQPELFINDLREAVDAYGAFDYVIHNAGITQPKHPHQFEQGNATVTRKFAEALVEAEAGVKKFIYMGSMAAIGPGSIEAYEAIDETQAPAPITPYGRSKLLAERYLSEIADLPHIILRPSAVYGPADAKFLGRIVDMVGKGIDVRLGSRSQRVSFIHVADLSRAALNACTVDFSNEAYNLSDGQEYRQSDFTAAVKRALGKKTVSMRIPTSLLVSGAFANFTLQQAFGRQVHLSHFKMRELTALNWIVNIDKARDQLNFHPKFDVWSGVADALKK